MVVACCWERILIVHRIRRWCGVLLWESGAVVGWAGEQLELVGKCLGGLQAGLVPITALKRES
jgi:hypothetical protein